MKLNQKNHQNFNKMVDKNENVIYYKANENLHYLYPNGHRITHQMRWFKFSRDRGLQSEISA